jgi:hypothetical protein
MKSFETGLRDDILAADLRPILRLPVSPSQSFTRSPPKSLRVHYREKFRNFGRDKSFKVSTQLLKLQ